MASSSQEKSPDELLSQLINKGFLRPIKCLFGDEMSDQEGSQLPKEVMLGFFMKQSDNSLKMTHVLTYEPSKVLRSRHWKEKKEHISPRVTVDDFEELKKSPHIGLFTIDDNGRLLVSTNEKPTARALNDDKFFLASRQGRGPNASPDFLEATIILLLSPEARIVEEAQRFLEKQRPPTLIDLIPVNF